MLLSITASAQEVGKGKSKENRVTTKSIKAGSNHTMIGAYALTSVKLKVNDKDSAINLEQLKIYTDRHFMYVHPIEGDSLGGYGIGTYIVHNGKLKEYPFYTGSAGETRDKFELVIQKRADGYSQVIKFPPDSTGKVYVLTENYKSTGKNIRSPLDGAWKLVKVTEHAANGTSTIVSDLVQFKVYQSGNVMWASTTKDSVTQKPVSFYGYGIFKMQGTNRVSETMTSSTFRTALVGNTVTLLIQFNGKDTYQQTINWPDGSKSVELYQRLK